MKKYILSFAVAVMALGAMAFTKGETPTKTRVIQYQFEGTLIAQANDPAFWTEVASSTPSCPSGTNLPCNVLTEMEIEDWLSNKSDEQVRTQANSRKN